MKMNVRVRSSPTKEQGFQNVLDTKSAVRCEKVIT